MENQEERDALEAEAVPLCRAWRLYHPEVARNGETWADGTTTPGPVMVPAPYCCSAYCGRCQGLRMLDGERLIEPNEWMNS